jgi:hypothetical protein
VLLLIGYLVYRLIRARRVKSNIEPILSNVTSLGNHSVIVEPIRPASTGPASGLGSAQMFNDPVQLPAYSKE